MTSGAMGAAMTQDDPFDFFKPEFSQNPYPFYEWLRENDPVHWGISADVGETGMWHVARHADIQTVLRDPRYIHRQRPPGDNLPPMVALFLELAGQSLLFNNPPAHTRLRGLVSKAFTPRAIEALRPQIMQTSDALVTGLATQPTFDVIRDYAQPLTVKIISAMLGAPTEAQPQVTAWARTLVRAIDCKQTPDVFFQAGEVAQDIYTFFLELIERHRSQPNGAILSALIQAHDADDRLSEAELIVTAATLLMAGHETTVNLIGNGMRALLSDPEQFALLRERPELAAGAVEEALRYDAPSQMTSREATVESELGGMTIAPGQMLNLLIGSGNRDPLVFADPDRFDITRAENRHLSFGMGLHYCLGAPLARMEGQIALPTLVNRFPTLRLDEAVWRDTIGFRGLQRLVVSQES